MKALLQVKKLLKTKKDTFGKYAAYEEKIKLIPPHRYLALSRGEKLKFLKVSLKYEEEPLLNYIRRDFAASHDFNDFIIDSIKDSLKRLLLPSIEK